MTTRNRLDRGTRGSIPNCSPRERAPITKLQTPEMKDTPESSERGENNRLTWTDFMVSTRPAQSTTNRDGSVTCNCGKVCKNKRGFAIHQGKSGCQRVRSSGQCILVASLASEKQEYPGLDSNHSTGELSVQETAPDVFWEPEEDEDPLLELLQTQSSFDPEQETGPDRPQQDTATRPRKPRIKWPKASDKTLWKQLDEDLDNILEASLQGPVDRKPTTLTTLIYSVGKERFGLEEERVQKDTPRPNRRQIRIQNLRRELRQLRRRCRDISSTERVGLTQLRATLRSQLTSLQKAENTRRKIREMAKKRAAFTANPYEFARSSLDKERSGKLETPLEEVEKYLQVPHSDPNREDALGYCERIGPVKAPEKQLEVSETSFGQVKDVVKKARTASTRTQCHTVQGVQSVPFTSQAVMKALESSLAEGGCSSLLEGGGRNIYTKQTEFQDGQPV